MKLIIDIHEEIYKASKIIDVKYEDVVQIPLEIIANGTPIPDNATNEKAIRALFPYTIFVEDISTNRIVISKDWWDSPYQKGGKE